eukprot:TRINITY_DN102961_c0_g1_i1.p1 TRINITY_DN102961_c0_g1~~TRINITY_DN102961_c0_g1_i1.p1  ORF type:complete len:1555 (+),score=386.83 TRINITY_DN102961_c0_g1_i1:73-4737(+)
MPKKPAPVAGKPRPGKAGAPAAKKTVVAAKDRDDAGSCLPAGPTGLLAGLAQEVEKGCQRSLKGGSGDAPLLDLPGEAIERLAHLAWEAKMASWMAPTDFAPQAPFAQVLAGLEDTLSTVFKALEKHQHWDRALPHGSGAQDAGALAAARSSSSAGLKLAALVLDLAAMQPVRGGGVGAPSVQPGEEVLSSAVSFLWQQARFALPMLIAAKLGEEVVQGLARAFRSMHHVLAARRFRATALPAPCLAHRPAALASQCLQAAAGAPSTCPPGLGGALAVLAAAAGDLLVSLAGQGCGEAMQATAVGELCKMAGHSALLKANSSGRGKGATTIPSQFLSLALRSVGAACLPLRLLNFDLGSLVNEGARQLAIAESRAGGFAAALLQQALLEVQTTGQQVGNGTHSLEVCVQQLCSGVCADPQWAAAPLFAVSFIRALFNVASAARGADLECSKRDQATRLLGLAAEALCLQRAEAIGPAAACRDCASCGAKEVAAGVGCDFCALQRWRTSVKVPLCGAAAKLEPTTSEESQMQLLLTFLDHAGHRSGEIGLIAPGGDLEGSAVPASSEACNNAALLCFLAGAVSCERGDGKASGKKRNRSAAAAATASGDKRARATPKKEAKIASAWAMHCWGSRGQVHGPSRAALDDPGPSRAAARLYRRLLWRGQGGGFLRRARELALNSLVLLARSNPLAHVRRQALLGLAAAAAAEPELLVTRCLQEAVALGLQDDSALARQASVELVAQAAKAGGGGQALVELQVLAKGRMQDPSPLVRRVAYRACCEWLESARDEKTLVDGAGELLRKLRQEQASLRTPALCALERPVLAAGEGEEKLDRLAALLAAPGVGGPGVRDLLAAHCSRMEASSAVKAMEDLAADAIRRLQGGRPLQPQHGRPLHGPSATPWLSLLEQVSLEQPAALHGWLWQLQAWLALPAEKAEAASNLQLPSGACKIVSNIIPSWAASASPKAKENTASQLRQQLAALLQELPADLGLVARDAVQCLAVTAAHLSPAASELLLGHFSRSVRFLHEASDCRPDSAGRSLAEVQGRLCRHAWIVGSVLEFLDAGSLAWGSQAGGSADLAAEAVVGLLGGLCLHPGCASARPVLLPALGFALRCFPQLLRRGAGSEAAGDLGLPLEALRHSAAASLGDEAAAQTLRARAFETIAGLLAAYQELAQAKATLPAAAATVQASAASEAAQRLATLQSELLQSLRPAEAEATSWQALRGLRLMASMGVLHPPSTLPCLVAATLTVKPSLPAGPLLQQLVEAAPPLLATRLGAGLRSAAGLLSGGVPAPSVGVLCSCLEAWRFEALREAYTEHLTESRQLRDQFLDAVIGEITGFAAQEQTPQTEEQELLLLRAGLAAGLLLRLPLRREGELLRLLERARRFLALQVAPLLLEEGDEAAPEGDASQVNAAPALAVPSLGLCAAALLLQGICGHWLQVAGEDFSARMLAAAAGSAQLDSPEAALPQSLVRAPAPDMTKLLELLSADAGNCSQLSRNALLSQQLPSDSPLLGGALTTRRRKRQQEEVSQRSRNAPQAGAKTRKTGHAKQKP